MRRWAKKFRDSKCQNKDKLGSGCLQAWVTEHDYLSADKIASALKKLH